MKAKTLFELDDDKTVIPSIPGLSYLPEYLSVKDEQKLCEWIDAGEWNTAWERRRQLYGGAYGRGNEPVRPIPEWGLSLADRLYRDGISERRFDHMLINEYLPGQGIAMHCDYDPYDRTVVSLSLLSPCVMDFRRVRDKRAESMLLQPRSMLVLTDEARYEWQHGIARRKKDRWQGTILHRARRLSVTFRLHKEPPTSTQNGE